MEQKPLWARDIKKRLAGHLSLAAHPEVHAIGGRYSGLKNALSGELARRSKNGGSTQGPKNVENGSLEQARKRYEELHGSLSEFGTSETRAAGGHTVYKLYGNIGPHTRWHVKRGIVKEGCDLCASSRTPASFLPQGQLQ
jgi:hypothetical protein